MSIEVDSGLNFQLAHTQKGPFIDYLTRLRGEGSSRSPCLGAYSMAKLRQEFRRSVLVLARRFGGGFAGVCLCLD